MKYFKQYQNFILEKTSGEELKDVLQNKHGFLNEYSELLKSHQKAIKKGVIDSAQEEFKKIFLAMCVTYHIDTIDILKKYTSKFENGKFKDINNFYVNYYQEDLKNKADIIAKAKAELDAKEKEAIKAKEEAIRLAKEEADKKAQQQATNATATYALTDADKTLLTTPKTLETVYFGRKIANRTDLVSFINRFFNLKNNITLISQDTDEAIKKYQTNKGLTVDGKIGKDTWSAIYADLKIPFDAKYLNPLMKNVNSVKKEKGQENNNTNTTVPQGELTSAKANQTITNLSNMFEGIVNEKIDTLDGVEMIVNKPFDPKTNKIEVSFKKDGKELIYKSSALPQGTKVISLDINPKTGKFNTTTKTNLLNNLSVDSTPVTVDKSNIFSGDMNNIVDEIIDLLDGYTGAGAIKEIYDLLSPLLNTKTGKAKEYFDTYEETNVDAYEYFAGAYKRAEKDNFEDDLNSVGTTTFEQEDIDVFNNLIKLIHKLNPSSTLQRK